MSEKGEPEMQFDLDKLEVLKYALGAYMDLPGMGQAQIAEVEKLREEVAGKIRKLERENQRGLDFQTLHDTFVAFGELDRSELDDAWKLHQNADKFASELLKKGFGRSPK